MRPVTAEKLLHYVTQVGVAVLFCYLAKDVVTRQEQHGRIIASSRREDKLGVREHIQKWHITSWHWSALSPTDIVASNKQTRSLARCMFLFRKGVIDRIQGRAPVPTPSPLQRFVIITSLLVAVIIVVIVILTSLDQNSYFPQGKSNITIWHWIDLFGSFQLRDLIHWMHISSLDSRALVKELLSFLRSTHNNHHPSHRSHHHRCHCHFHKCFWGFLESQSNLKRILLITLILVIIVIIS